MPKRSKEKVEIDVQKIVKLIQNNARISFNELAEQSGFSRQKIWRIIKNLEKNKTIWGYTTILDLEKLGLKQFFIMLKRKGGTKVDKQIESVINRKIKKQLEKIGVFIESSFYTHGDYDWISIATAESIKEIKKYLDYIHNDFSDILSDVKIIEVLFPLEKNNIENPNKQELLEFF